MNKDAEISERSPSDYLIEAALASTPARLLVGRAGSSYRTQTALKLRADHAAARDAVYAELDLVQSFGQARIDRLQLFETHTRAGDRAEHLLRPDLGRRLTEQSFAALAAQRGEYDVAFVVADGLSARAIARHAAPVLARTLPAFRAEGRRIAPLVLVCHGRVAIGDAIANALGANSVAILIGERPGLSAPDSMGAALEFPAVAIASWAASAIAIATLERIIMNSPSILCCNPPQDVNKTSIFGSTRLALATKLKSSSNRQRPIFIDGADAPCD